MSENYPGSTKEMNGSVGSIISPRENMTKTAENTVEKKISTSLVIKSPKRNRRSSIYGNDGTLQLKIKNNYPKKEIKKS